MLSLPSARARWAKLARLMSVSVTLALTSFAWAQEFTLKVHHFWPPQAMGPSTILKPWAEKIEKESAGRIKIQIFPAMQLGGKPADLLDQARDGVVDIVWTLPGYTAGRYPTMEVFELPFMTNSAQSASRAAWDFYTAYGSKEFPGLKMLAMHVHDEGYAHTRERQIKVLADFKGLKLRAPTRQSSKLVAALGATPIAMPLPQVVESLSKGVIDGFLLPWEVIPSIKAHELVKFHTETDPKARALYTAVFAMAMNKSKYDTLPADLQKVIDHHSGADFSGAIGKAWDDSQPRYRQAGIDRGNKFYTVPASELALWEKATASLAEDWVREMSGKGLDGKVLLQAARDGIKKYEAPLK